MGLSSQHYASVLTSAGLISAADFAQLDQVAQTAKKPLEDVILERKIVEEAQLGQLLAKAFKLPAWEKESLLLTMTPPYECSLRIP